MIRAINFILAFCLYRIMRRRVGEVKNKRFYKYEKEGLCVARERGFELVEIDPNPPDGYRYFVGPNWQHTWFILWILKRYEVNLVKKVVEY